MRSVNAREGEPIKGTIHTKVEIPSSSVRSPAERHFSVDNTSVEPQSETKNLNSSVHIVKFVRSF